MTAADIPEVTYMLPKKIKAIIVDLDRTLLRSDKTISPYTIDILRRCQSAGLKVMAATARPQRAVGEFADAVQFDALTVSNGARILCNDPIQQSIARETADRLLKILASYPHLRVTVETGDQAYSNLPIGEYDTILSDDLTIPAAEEGVVKILIHIDREDTLPLITDILSDDLYMTVAHDTLIQIMDKKATKMNGIEVMLRRFGISIDNAVYFGDDEDDIQPLTRCGIGVAMANGIDAAKDAADAIAESNDEDGVAVWLEKNLLRDHIE